MDDTTEANRDATKRLVRVNLFECSSEQLAALAGARILCEACGHELQLADLFDVNHAPPCSACDEPIGHVLLDPEAAKTLEGLSE